MPINKEFFDKLMQRNNRSSSESEPSSDGKYEHLKKTFTSTIESIDSFLSHFSSDGNIKKVVSTRSDIIEKRIKDKQRELSNTMTSIEKSIPSDVSSDVSSEESKHMKLKKEKKTLNDILNEIVISNEKQQGVFSSFVKKVQGFKKKRDSTNISKVLSKTNTEILIKVDNIHKQLEISNYKTNKILKTINISQINETEKSYVSMVKEYGKNFIINTFGKVFTWIHSASSDIDKVFSWIGEKGISVMKWFKDVALNPLQAMWTLTKNLAKIGWDAIKTVYTVLAWPVKKAMNFLVKALKTILFNPVIFIPLLIFGTIMATKFFKIFKPIIVDIVGSAWLHIKKMFGKFSKMTEKLFSPIWTTITGWINDLFQWIFSEKHAKMLITVMEKFIGITYDHAKKLVNSVYDVISKLVNYGIWNILGHASILATKVAWNALLIAFGIDPNDTTPSDTDGHAYTIEKNLDNGLRNLEHTKNEGDNLIDNASESTENEFEKNVERMTKNTTEEFELEATKQMEEGQKELATMQESKSSQLSQMGENATNQYKEGVVEGTIKKIEPQIEKAKKAKKGAETQLELNQKMKDAIGPNPKNINQKKIKEIERHQILSDRDTSRKEPISKKQQARDKQFETISPMKNIQTVTSKQRQSSADPRLIVKSSFNNIQENNINKILNMRMTTHSHSTLYNTILSAQKVQLASKVNDLKEGNDTTENVVFLTREIAKMEDIGTDKDEMLEYISSKAPQYRTMTDLIYWTHTAHKFENQQSALSPKEKQNANRILSYAHERINDLNSQISNRSMSGSNKKYDPLNSSDISFENGNLVLNNNWMQDPIFSRIMNSSNFRKRTISGESGPDIPEMELGAIVTDATLALVGEGLVSEIILPLNKRGVEFILNSINEIVDTSSEESKRKIVEKAELVNKNSITRIIAGNQTKKDMALYDMKLLSMGEIGAG